MVTKARDSGPGATRREQELTYDILDGAEPPRTGDILRPTSPRAKAWYEVLTVRPVESRVWHDRWRLRVRRIDPNPTIDEVTPGCRILTWAYYSKGEGPQEAAAKVRASEAPGA